MRETQPAYDEDQAAQLRLELEQIVMDWTGLRPDLAAPMASAILEGMRQRLGGRRLYVPAPRSRDAERRTRAERDQQIVAMFNGRNLAEVMRTFDVSRRTVYNVLSRARPKSSATHRIDVAQPGGNTAGHEHETHPLVLNPAAAGPGSSR